MFQSWVWFEQITCYDHVLLFWCIGIEAQKDSLDWGYSSLKGKVLSRKMILRAVQGKKSKHEEWNIAEL